MKKSLYLSFFLAVISIISAFILSMTNSLTSETIKNANIAKQNKKLQAMFNDKTKFTEEKISKENPAIEKVFKAEEDGKVTGYVYNVVTKGYGGKIKFLVAISSDGKYIAFDSLEHNETPGFGTKMDEPKFKGQFKDKPVTDEVDGISGATITTKGLKKGFDAAVKDFEKNYKK